MALNIVNWLIRAKASNSYCTSTGYVGRENFNGERRKQLTL